MTDVHVFCAAIDTIVAGIYEFDTFYAVSVDESAARDLFENADPWDGVSTSVEAYLGTAEELADDDRTSRDIMYDRYMEDDDAE